MGCYGVFIVSFFGKKVNNVFSWVDFSLYSLSSKTSFHNRDIFNAIVKLQVMDLEMSVCSEMLQNFRAKS